MLYVHEIDAGDFLNYALGYTERVPGPPYPILRRVAPLQLPYNPPQYLTDLVMVGHGDWTADFIFDNWPKWGWIKYKATFTTLPYSFVADSALPTLSGAPNELCRYVASVQRPMARERKVPTYTLETDDGNPINETAFIIDEYIDYTYTWYEVPLEAYPLATILNCAGKVNSASFDPTMGVGGDARIWMNGGVEYVLFRGVAGEVTPYRGSTGRMYVDITYLFSQRYGSTWNQYIKADGTVIGIRYRGTSRRPYQTADLNTLFQPL
jgi:hypothetical protein